MLLAFVYVPSAQAESVSPLARAKAAESELQQDESKLRLRHNIEKLEQLFVDAAEKGPAHERSEALLGRVRAARLLARWSGRADDDKRARVLAEALETAPAEVAARPPVEAPRPDARMPRLEGLEIEIEEERLLVALPGLEKAGVQLVRQEVLGRGGDRPRIYFDVRPLTAAPAVLTERPIDDARVKRLRVGQVDEKTVRFVFDLEPGAELASIRFERAPKLAFVVPRPEREKVLVDQSPAVSPKVDEREAVLAQKEALERLLEEIVKEPKAPSPRSIVSEPPPSAPEEKRAEPRPSGPPPALARSTREALKPRIESPLRIRRVVVDAGHGGKDVGAVGRRGTREKDVNLALARALGRKLEKELGIEVVYTRTKDKFVSLERRAQIANAANADLFISVHSNANRNRKIRGIETYYLNTTSSRYSNRLANRENRDMHDPALITDDSPEEAENDEESAPLPSGPVGRDLRLLLADLAMRSAAEESRRLAGYIQHTTVDHLSQPDRVLKDLGVKKALFFVLLGVRMPAVLVESGFLSHEEEEQALADAKYRDRLASAIAHGVRRYVEERHELAARY